MMKITPDGSALMTIRRSAFWIRLVVLALLAVAFETPALAQPDGLVAGSLEGGYLNSGDPRHVNDWAELGSVVFTFGNPGLNVQLNAANDNSQIPTIITNSTSTLNHVVTLVSTTSKPTGEDWKYGGDFFLRGHAGILGIDGGAETLTSHTDTTVVTTVIPPKSSETKTTTHSTTSTRINLENVGLFGEYFALPALTLRGKGGWVTGEHNGYYGDGQVAYYPYRQFAVSVSADYSRLETIQEVKSVTADLEYLPVPAVPVSLDLRYTHANVSLPTTAFAENMFGAAIKIYFGGRGTSLRDYQRNGTSLWNGPPSGLGGARF